MATASPLLSPLLPFEANKPMTVNSDDPSWTCLPSGFEPVANRLLAVDEPRSTTKACAFTSALEMDRPD